jgi:ABC-type molybdate transport system substrate-binding protein/alkylhydroperoxidase family enzyme
VRRPLLAILIMTATAAGAAEIRVMSSLATREAWLELVPQFEKASGHRVRIDWVGSQDMMKRLRGGETTDLVVMSASAIDEQIKEGHVVAGSRVDLASSVIGVAVRAGAPKPDLSSGESLKRALLAAKSVAYSSGPSGVYLAGLFKKWGIPEGKITQTPPGSPVGEVIARGGAEIGFQQVSELLPIQGIDFVGPIPADVQLRTVFSAGTHARATQAEAAKTLTAFMTSAAAVPVLRAKGLEPAGQEGARFKPLAPEAMTDAQRKVYQEIAGGPRGGVRGPFNPLLRSPELADRAQKMGEYIRFNTSLPPRLSEFAILITARYWGSQYEWHAHHPFALKGGLPPKVAEELAQGKRPSGMTEDETAVYDFCSELHRDKAVSDSTYATAIQRFGERGVVDLIGVSGYYTLVSMVLNVDRHPLPAGAQPQLPRIEGALK